MTDPPRELDGRCCHCGVTLGPGEPWVRTFDGRARCLREDCKLMDRAAQRREMERARAPKRRQFVR